VNQERSQDTKKMIWDVSIAVKMPGVMCQRRDGGVMSAHHGGSGFANPAGTALLESLRCY
jgi:hypothetical protein